ncbi:beta-alanine-activating enzyme beta-propeller domain-containing protein [Candidatus Uabimicrobium amorphum]|uniref:non-specific serine/threonine protein kinase n=1 Tax=Uabimicrobium amorphum TaxID=2596890 RepID=A0A5S9F203_UABAM|nr:serine/threonine-protein kinase [Candidatus Uabimicrobium amorphum]BBM82952.1 protein kinase [Candidatus Uabimicrobium amorphum]
MATAKDKEFARVTAALGFIKQTHLQSLWKQYEKQNYYQRNLSFAQWLVQNKFLSLAQVATIEHQIIKKAKMSETSDSDDIDHEIKSVLEDEEYYVRSDRVQTIDNINFDDMPAVASTVYDEEPNPIPKTFSTNSNEIPNTLVGKLPPITNESSGNIPQTLFEGNAPVKNESSGNIPQTLFEGNAPVKNESSGNIPQTLFEGNAPVKNSSSSNIPQTLFEGNSPLSTNSSKNIPQTLFEGNSPGIKVPSTLYDNDAELPQIQHDRLFDNPFPLPNDMLPETQVAGASNKLEESEVELVHSEFSAEAVAIKPGKKFGRYDIIGEIGRGGMGKVYKVYDASTKKILALKVLLSTEERETERMGRFLREAFLSSKFDHPNIVAVHDIGNEEGNIFFTMDFIEGKTLDQVIKERSLTRRQIVELMIKVTQAVAHAHGKKIIHRDLKPENIIIDKNKEPKVMDFGLAKIINEDSKLSKSGMIIGTVHYMPPEQADGLVKELDERSDTYALGAILYELITNRTPFTGSSFSEVIDQILYQNPPPPSKVAKRVPKDLEKICLKAIEKEKEDRYQSANDLVKDLTAFSRGHKVNIKNSFWPKIARNVKKNLRSRRTKFLAAFVSLFAICVFLLISVFQSKEEYLTQQDISFSLVNSKKNEQSTFSVGENIYLLVRWLPEKQVKQHQVYLEFYGKELESYQSNYTQQQTVNELLTNVKVLVETPGKYELVSKISIGKLQKEQILSFSLKPLKAPVKENVKTVMFRENLQRTGIMENVSKTSFTKLYRSFAIPGGVWAAPIEDSGKLYLATDVGSVYAYDYIKNQQLWTFKIKEKLKGKRNIYRSPTIAGKFLYFGSENGKFYALNKNTGSTIWEFKTQGVIRSSAIINEHHCYFGSGDGKLYCLNRFSGELIWSYSAKGPIASSPAFDKGTIYVGDYASFLHAVDCEFGRNIWSHKTSDKITSPPTVVGDRVYFANSAGVISAIQATTGIIEWTYKGKSPIIFAAPTVINDTLFCGSYSGLHIINVLSGKKIRFLRTKHRIYSSPIATKSGIVYCTSDEGRIYVLDVNNLKKTFISVPENNRAKAMLSASPTIRNGYLFVASTKGHIFIFK